MVERSSEASLRSGESMVGPGPSPVLLSSSVSGWIPQLDPCPDQKRKHAFARGEVSPPVSFWFAIWCCCWMWLLLSSSLGASAAPIVSSWSFDALSAATWGGNELRGNRDYGYGGNVTNLTVSGISVSSTAGLVIDVGLMTWVAVTGGNGGIPNAKPVASGEPIQVNVLVENCTFDSEGYLWIFNYTGAMKYLPPAGATSSLPLWISVTVRNCTFLNATLVVADAACDPDRSRNECSLAITGNLFQRSNLDQSNVVRNFRPFTPMNLAAIGSPTLHTLAIGPLCQHTTLIGRNRFLWSNISSYWYSRVIMFGDWIQVAGGMSRLLRYTSFDDFTNGTTALDLSAASPSQSSVPPASWVESPLGPFNLSAQAILDFSGNAVQFTGDAAQANMGILLDFRSMTLISVRNGSVLRIANNYLEVTNASKFAALATSTLGARTVVEGVGSAFIIWSNTIQVSTSLYAAHGVSWSNYLDLSVGGKWLCVENNFTFYSESGQTYAVQMPIILSVLGPGRVTPPQSDSFNSVTQINAFSTLSPFGTAFNVSSNVVKSTCNKSTACGSAFEVWRLDVSGWEESSSTQPAAPFLSTCDTEALEDANDGGAREGNVNGLLFNENTIVTFSRQSDATGIQLLGNGVTATGGTQIVGGRNSGGGVSQLTLSLSRNIITIDAGLSSFGINVARAITFGRSSRLQVQGNTVWMRPASAAAFSNSAFSAISFGGMLFFRNGSLALLNGNSIQSSGRSGIGLALMGIDLKSQSTVIVADNMINASQSSISVNYMYSQAVDLGTCILLTRNSLFAYDVGTVQGEPAAFQFYSGLLLANGSIFSVERNFIWSTSTARSALGMDFTGVLTLSGPPTFTPRISPAVLTYATFLGTLPFSFPPSSPSPLMRIRHNNITAEGFAGSVPVKLTVTLVENQAQVMVSDNVIQARAGTGCAVGINLMGGGDTTIPILFRAGAQLIIHRNAFSLRSFLNSGNCGICAGSAFGTKYLGRLQFEDRSSFFFCANTVNGTATRVQGTCMNRLVLNQESVCSIDSNRVNVSVSQDRAAMSLFWTELQLANASLLNVHANNATIYDSGFGGSIQIAYLILVDTTGTTTVNISRGASFSVRNNHIDTWNILSESYLVQLNYFNAFFGASWIVSGNALNVFCRPTQPAGWVELVTVTTVSVGHSNSTITVTKNSLTSTCTISSGVNFGQGLRLTLGSSFYLMENRLNRPLAFKDVNYKLVKLGSNNQGLIVDDSTGALNAIAGPLELSRLTFQCNFLNDSSLSSFDGDLKPMLPNIVGLPGPFSYFFDCAGKLLTTPGGTSSLDPRITNDVLCALLFPSRCDAFGAAAVSATSSTASFTLTLCNCTCRNGVTLRVEPSLMMGLNFSMRSAGRQCTPILSGQSLAPLTTSRFRLLTSGAEESTSLCSNPTIALSRTASRSSTVSASCSLSNQTNAVPSKNTTVNVTTSAPAFNLTNVSTNASTPVPTATGLPNGTAVSGTTPAPSGPPNSSTSQPIPTPLPSNIATSNGTGEVSRSQRRTRTVTPSHPYQPGRPAVPVRSHGGVVSMATQSEVVSRSVLALGSAGAALGGLVGNPALAGQAIRISSVTGSVYCLFSDADDAPSLLEQPFQIAIGSGPLPYYVGSTLLTTVVFLAFPWLVHGALRVVASRYGGSATIPRWLRLLQGKAVSNLALVALSYMGPSVVKGAVLVLGHSSEPLDLGLMAVCLCAVLVAVGVVFWAAIPSGEGRYEVRYIAKEGTGTRKPELVGIPAASMFVESFGLVIDAARDPEQRSVRVYLCVDLGVSMGLMVLDGVRPMSGSCAPIAGTMVAVCLLHLVYLGLVRPMRSKLEQLFCTLGALILVVLASIALTLTLNDSAALLQAFGVLALLDSGLFFVEAVALGFWAYTVRQRRLTRTRQALVDGTDDSVLGTAPALLEIPLKEKDSTVTPSAEREGGTGASDGTNNNGQRYNPLWQS